MPKNLREIYQLKITLKNSKPVIWRRIQIASVVDLEELHEILQVAMGWTNSHLHQFIINGERYGVPDPDFDFDDDIINEKNVKISQLLKSEGDRMLYEYDFGDGWEHELILEKILPFYQKVELPRCISGKRGCPPEDVGGIWGYSDFLEKYRDKTHPEHKEMVEWAGPYFDPDSFDHQTVNEIFTGNEEHA